MNQKTATSPLDDPLPICGVRYAAIRRIEDGEHIVEINESLILLEQEIERNNEFCGWRTAAPVVRLAEVEFREIGRIGSSKENRTQMKRLKGAKPGHTMADTLGTWSYEAGEDRITQGIREMEEVQK